jgi:hypothetical protein
MAHDARPAGDAYVAVCGTLSVMAGDSEKWRAAAPPSAHHGSVREKLRAMATETMAIIEAGGYRSPGGRDVRIAPGIKAAVAGTRLHLPGEKVPAPRPARDGALITEVTNETSLSAARRLGANVACLVFASAKNPGGGFLTGAQAQEESIARSSALHQCQNAAREFYDFHRRQRDLRYSDRIIYSPGVLAARAERILAVAASHGHRKLVLGAWGCGVFGNDPAVVAAAFTAGLARTGGQFDQVVFAVLDRQRGAPTHAAFARALGRSSLLEKR